MLLRKNEMEKELQGKLVEILTSIQSTIGEVKDFTFEQLPDVVVSYIKYGTVMATIEAMFFIPIAVLSVYGVFKLFQSAKRTGDPDYFGAGILAGAFACIPVALAWCTLNNALLAWIAPKVWLLKSISSMLK
jgi:hypothetical protein